MLDDLRDHNGRRTNRILADVAKEVGSASQQLTTRRQAIMLKKGQHGKRVYFGRDAFSNDIFAVIDTVLDTIAGRRF